MSENSKSFLQTISSSWEHKELLTSSWAKKDVVALLQIPTKSNYKNTAIQKYEIPATTLRSPRCEPNYLPLTNTKYQKSNTKIQIPATTHRSPPCEPSFLLQVLTATPPAIPAVAAGYCHCLLLVEENSFQFNYHWCLFWYISIRIDHW